MVANLVGILMSWSLEDVRRSYVCNQGLLKFFRERKGWSQQQLASESGVSVRVICKVEGGESVSAKSIERIATALCCEDRVVYPEDLISYPVELAKAFVASVHEYRERRFEGCGCEVEAEAVFRVVGDPERIPLAGNYAGLEEYKEALGSFLSVFEHAPSFDPKVGYECFCKGNDVVLCGDMEFWPIAGDGEAQSFRHRHRFRFRRGRLWSSEEQYSVEDDGRLASGSETADVR